jgi:hypothetical protein
MLSNIDKEIKPQDQPSGNLKYGSKGQEEMAVRWINLNSNSPSYRICHEIIVLSFQHINVKWRYL